LVRKRNGWRVVELPAIANLIEEGYSRRGYIKDRDPKMSKREIKV
jgi:hypothetical protein